MDMTLSAKNPMRVVLLSTLLFEVIVFGLAIPVLILIGEVAPGAATGFSGGTAVLALAAAGLLRKNTGYYVGWAAQLAGILLGLLMPVMFVVGGMFALIWLISFILGRRLDAQAAQAG